MLIGIQSTGLLSSLASASRIYVVIMCVCPQIDEKGEILGTSCANVSVNTVVGHDMHANHTITMMAQCQAMQSSFHVLDTPFQRCEGSLTEARKVGTVEELFPACNRQAS